MINVVLFEPEIPQNTGNIMRTCAGTNVKLHLIKPYGFSLDEKSVKRSGANYLQFVNYVEYDDFEDFSNKNKGTYFFITRYGQKAHSDIDYKAIDQEIYFIFGKESSGIPNAILKPYFDNCLRIPMNDKIRSLNVSNTVSIVVYEALRQFNYANLLKTEPFKGEDYILKG